MANAARTMRASGPREDALIAKLNAHCAPEDAKPAGPAPAPSASAAP
jgi:hypothetical protein